MISHLEAFHYRCFDQLAIEMDAYHVLAGANGSGESTLLDIPMLFGDMLSKGLLPALLETSSPTASARAQSLQELIHCRRGNYFSFAMEATLPESTVATLVERVPTSVQKDQKKWPHRLRYEVSFEVFNYTELHVTDEFLYIVPQHTTRPEMGWSINGHRPRTWKTILARTSGEPVVIHAEYHRERFVLRLRPQQLALANLPYDFHLFPASGWFKELFEAWVEHVKMALPYLVAIDAVEREEDHHAYLKLTYQGGYTVTSSGLSDGTLRILALTIRPYLSRAPRIICVEEPENSIHPRAIELVLQSLTSFYDSQVWVATHSPMVLAHTDLKAVIVMRGSAEGNAGAIAGAEHPQLRDWQGEIDLGSLFAAGVLR